MSLRVNNLVGFGAGGKKLLPQSASNYRAFYSSTTAGTSFTFSAADLGEWADNRVVTITIGYERTQVLSAVTIAGVTATNVSTNAGVAIYRAALPDQVSAGDVVITFTASTSHCAIGTFALYGLVNGGTPLNTPITSTADPGNLNQNTSAACIIIGAAYANNTAAALTWTGPTEQFDTAIGTVAILSGAISIETSAATPKTITADFTGTFGISRSIGAVFD